MKSGFVQVFKTEWLTLWSTPKRWFYTLILPLLLFFFLGATFKSGVPRALPLAYLNLDQSQLSYKLTRIIDATPTIALAYNVTNEEEAKQLMEQMKVYGFIVIPKNFQKNIYKGLDNTVICYTNNQYLSPAGLIQKDFLTAVGTFSAGITIEKQTKQGIQTKAATANIQPVITNIHTLYNPFSNYAYYLLVALFPMMFQMVVMVFSIYVLAEPLKYHTANQWLALSNNKPWHALWGKLLPYTLCFLFVAWWMNVLLFGIIKIPLQTQLLNVWLITAVFVLVFQTLAVAIVAITPDMRTALTIGGGFTAIAFSFAGYTFPMEGLPKSMQIVSALFPYAHYMKYFVNRAIKGIPIAFSYESFVALTLFILLFILAYPKFVKRLNIGHYD